MADVVFYFDVVCPYAYLASTQIEALARRAGATLSWRPMLLGGVFKAIGRGDEALLPQKVVANLQDLQRWSRRWGLPPISYPPGHPRRSVAAMRLCVVAERTDPARVAPVAHALFAAYWRQGRDIAEDRALLAELAAQHQLDVAAVDSDAVKQQLRANTDEAVAAGVFGAPSFLVTNPHGRFLFWGQDRLHFVEKALGGWQVPA